ncbi:MAG: ACP S-malonyltransferase [Ruminiclostridium sp.]
MKKVALLFPGQGSQYVGMGKKLYEEYLVAKETFNEANEVLGFDLKNLCFEGDIKELTKTRNAQLALLTLGVATFKVYMKEFGVKPQYSAGHSLGEYSALTCSNAIEFSDALKIVNKRGFLMQQASEKGLGKMAAVSGVDIVKIEEQCQKFSTKEEPVVIACYNSPKQNVISGHATAVEKVAIQLQSLGATVIPLKVSASFHSPMMQSAAYELRLELEKYKFSTPEWSVIANVNALPYEGNQNFINSLTNHMIQPVAWQKTVEYLQTQGVEVAFELGPKATLRNIIQESNKSIKVFLIDSNEAIGKVSTEFDIKSWKKEKTRMDLISKCIVTAVCTKNSNWDQEMYNKGVVEPYSKVKKIYEYLENAGKEPTEEQVCEAIGMLKSVLITKKLSDIEQKEILDNLVEDAKSLSILSINEVAYI